MYGSHLLLVDDDRELTAVLRQGLEQSGHAVSVAHDGEEGLRLAQTSTFAAIVLDVMLPGRDGFEVAAELRKRGDQTPVLMLTARDAESDVIRGLDAGAEDYMTKPFSFLELSARMRALIRRGHPAPVSLCVDDLVLDTGRRTARRGTRDLHLSPTHFRLLETLMRARGHVVQRRELIDEAWGAGARVENNTLDVAVGVLRGIVDRDFPRPLIRTVRGFGYRIGAE